MYDGALTSVRTTSRETIEFSVIIGLHQGWALSLYLFVLVMANLTRHLQDEVSWCILFTDDIVLIDETRNSINTKNFGGMLKNPKVLKLAELSQSIWSASLVIIGVEMRK
ncbi:hypothetical protein AMTRI_Chr05g69340 [Amborella trichopoda]